MCAFGCVFMAVYVWPMHVWLGTYDYVCMAYVCMAMYVWTCMYGYVCMGMYVWLCMYGYVCVAIYVWLGMYGYACDSYPLDPPCCI